MVDVRDLIRRVAPFPCSVLIEGETGTGKELVARALHGESQRRGGPFVPVNCAAIPESLAESHLFGHEAGAFSGTRGRHRGVLEQAQGGTLFLDEVAELSLSMQPRLLRSIQEREVVRVGSESAARPVQIDIRLVAASHQDLFAGCQTGRFREDLYYRLCEYRLGIPPLRARDRDVLELSRHFLRIGDGLGVRLGRDAQQLLLTYRWPGNVRELRAVLLAARVDARHGRIGAAELRRHLRLALSAPTDQVESSPTDTAPSVVSKADVLLDLLRDRGPTSMGELVTDTAIPRSSLRRLLVKLEETGAVVHVGEGRERRYSVERRAMSPSAKGVSPDGIERQAVALDHLRAHGTLSRREYVALTGASLRTANRDLEDMVRQGRIRSNGIRGRGAGYLLPDDQGDAGDVSPPAAR